MFRSKGIHHVDTVLEPLHENAPCSFLERFLQLRLTTQRLDLALNLRLNLRKQLIRIRHESHDAVTTVLSLGQHIGSNEFRLPAAVSQRDDLTWSGQQIYGHNAEKLTLGFHHKRITGTVYF